MRVAKRITKRQLRRIIKEEYSKLKRRGLIREDASLQTQIVQPVDVWLVNVQTGEKFPAFVERNGGYDNSILEGAIDGEEPYGMFLSSNDIDPYNPEGNPSDWDAIWDGNQDAYDDEETSLPGGQYRLQPR